MKQTLRASFRKNKIRPNYFVILFVAIMTRHQSIGLDPVDVMTSLILNDPHSSSITIFSNPASNNLQNNAIARVTDHIPATRVTEFWRKANSTYFILEDELCVESIEYTLQMLKNSSSLSRSRVLLVSSIIDVSPTIVHDILTMAWSYRVLDFTILGKENDSFHVHQLNPFTGVFYREPLQEGTILFPNKLQDLNNYPFKIASFDHPPYVVWKNGIPQGGTQYLYISTIAKKLNLLLEFMSFDGSNINKIFQNLLQSLETNELEMLPMFLLTNNRLSRHNVTIGKVILRNQFIMVGPVLPMKKFDASMSFLGIFLAILFFYVGLGWLFQLPNTWTACNILRALIGFVSSDRPRKPVHRILYWSLITISMNYAIHAFSGLFTVKMVPQILPFDNINKSLEHGLPIHVPDFIFHELDAIEFSRLKSVANITYHADCLRELAIRKDRICVALYLYAKHFVNNLTFVEGNVSIRLSKTPFHEDNLAFAYARHSPFVGRFDQLMTRIFESGIPHSWNEHFEYYKDGTSVESEESHVDASKLVKLLTCGMLISIVCFVLEMKFSPSLVSSIVKDGVNLRRSSRP